MKKYLTFLISLLISLSLTGQTVIDTLELSLDSCLSMAQRSNYDIRIAQMTKEKALSEKSSMSSMFFPKVSVNASALYLFNNVKILEDVTDILPDLNLEGITLPIPDLPVDIPIDELASILQNSLSKYWTPIELSLHGAYMAGINVQQPVFVGGRIVTGLKMTDIGRQMAEENIKLKKQEALLEAQQSYWLYVSVREKVKLAKTYERLLEQLEETVQNVEDVEMINRSDLLKVQVQHNEVKAQLLKAQSGIELSRMALCRVIGVDYDTPIVPSDTIIGISKHSVITLDNTPEKRPEYRLMQLNIEMKDMQLKNTRGTYLPMIALNGNFGYLGGLKINDNTQKPYNMSNIMAVLSIPITDWWEGSKKVSSARADKVISELEMRKNIDLLRLQIKQSISNLINSYKALENAEMSLDLAKENLRVSSDRFSVDMETVTDLMMSQAAWEKASSNLIDAQIDCRNKEIEYLKAIGELIPGKE